MDEIPAWLDSLVEFVADCMEVHNASGPLGMRCGQEGDHWDVMVYLAPGELVGGAVDGSIVSPGFSLDVQRLSAAFDQLVGVHWQAQAFSPHDYEGQYISVEGVYEGHDVYLQILSEAPEDEHPGFKLNTVTGAIEP